MGLSEAERARIVSAHLRLAAATTGSGAGLLSAWQYAQTVLRGLGPAEAVVAEGLQTFDEATMAHVEALKRAGRPAEAADHVGVVRDLYDALGFVRAAGDLTVHLGVALQESGDCELAETAFRDARRRLAGPI